MYKNIRSTKCAKCGKQINGSNIKMPFLNPMELGINMQNFYGGKVKKFVKAVCSCGAEYIAFLMPKNNGYEIIDIAEKIEDNKTKESDTNKSETIDLDKLDRKTLMAKAKELGIGGKLATIKTEDIKKLIKDKMQ